MISGSSDSRIDARVTSRTFAGADRLMSLRTVR